MGLTIERCTMPAPEWAEMRLSLWPDCGGDDLAETLQRTAVFLARDDTGAAIGFAEAELRRDYVNGCETSPVAFLEGIFVHPDHRRRGAATALTASVETWARTQNVQELASDALLENTASQALHAALGFTETERVVCFKKQI